MNYAIERFGVIEIYDIHAGTAINSSSPIRVAFNQLGNCGTIFTEPELVTTNQIMSRQMQGDVLIDESLHNLGDSRGK
jgi:hypothetical protein